jgi:muramoyltetrapeptide carboxypeptidase
VETAAWVYLAAVIFPPPLREGDTIAVVAPSSPFDRAAALAGIAWLKQRYRVRYRTSLFARDGYLAGSDRRRTTELQSAFDGDVKAIVAARGGYGLSRFVHQIDWANMLREPRWLVGFSDFTVLHVEAWRRGIASVHAPMVGSLATAGEAAQAQWLLALESPRRERQLSGLTSWRRGRAKGRLVGGNLAMLHACAAASRLVVPQGAVVLLEDIGERPYRVDRMLSNLITGGPLTRASAILVGDFTDCVAGADGRTVEQVLRERLSVLGIPVLADLPIGHGARNEAVVLGLQAEVDAGRCSCRLR